jgi:hypothetical protein
VWGIFSGDPVAAYLAEACSVAPLTEEEEVWLSEVLRARDSSLEPARLLLVEGNLRLVVSIARRHFGVRRGLCRAGYFGVTLDWILHGWIDRIGLFGGRSSWWRIFFWRSVRIGILLRRRLVGRIDGWGRNGIRFLDWGFVHTLPRSNRRA